MMTKEDMFDLVSYQKGGRILNMLRTFVGDDAFFQIAEQIPYRQ
jgi:aminopeptidase N